MTENKRKKILLGHLNSNGDCLFATVIARQIKEVDYPNCHLTWAVNSKCKQAVYLNPYIDEIWEIPTEKTTTSDEEWGNFAAEAEGRRQRGEFDLVFYTQIIGSNRLNYDGGIRSSIYNNYNHKITVSHQPTICLSEEEIENVSLFVKKFRLAEYDKIILIECGPKSFSVPLDQKTAYDLALEISKNRKIAFILSSDKPIISTQPNIIDGSSLTFRENAELTKYCDLFIGCSSGISWLATSDWAKKLPMILMVNRYNPVFPSMIFDHKHINLSVSHLIEIACDKQNSLNKLKRCLQIALDNNFEQAQKAFNKSLRAGNFDYLRLQLDAARKKSRPLLLVKSFFHYLKRNGIGMMLNLDFIRFFLDMLRGFLMSSQRKKLHSLNQ